MAGEIRGFNVAGHREPCGRGSSGGVHKSEQRRQPAVGHPISGPISRSLVGSAPGGLIRAREHGSGTAGFRDLITQSFHGNTLPTGYDI